MISATVSGGAFTLADGGATPTGTVTASGTPAQYDVPYWTTATNLTKITAPTTNGVYALIWNPVASAAVAPTATSLAALPAGTAFGSLDTGTPKWTPSANLWTSNVPVSIGGSTSGLDLTCQTAEAPISGSVGFTPPSSCAATYGHYNLPVLPASAGLFHVGAASSNVSAVTISAVVDGDFSGQLGLAHGGLNLDISGQGGACNTTGAQVLHQNAAHTVSVSCLAAADLPATLSSGTAITNAALTTPLVTSINDANGNPFIKSSATTSAVDSITLTNAAAANPATVTIGATGSDSNINLAFAAKGSGVVQIPNGATFNANALTAMSTTVPGTGVATWITTPSGANLASALTSALPNTKGGTGADSSSSTGIAQVSTGSWSFSTALANGTTATTQSANNNSTNVSTTAYADNEVTQKPMECTEVWGGTGTSSALASGDDAVADVGCNNQTGKTWTIIKVTCASDNASNTTTVNPTFGSAGTGTTILNSALTCGNSNAMASTTSFANATIASGNGINPVMGGSLTGTHIALVFVYTQAN